MEAVKSYLHELKEDESGMEMLQVAIIVALVALMIGVLAALFDAIWNKISDAEQTIEAIQMPNGTGSGDVSPYQQIGQTQPID